MAQALFMIINDEEKKVTAVHEAGHALLAVLLPHADPVHKVTIIPRGMALGVTMQLPVEDKHNYTREYLNDQIAILLGGRIAEEITMNGMPGSHCPSPRALGGLPSPLIWRTARPPRWRQNCFAILVSTCTF